MKMMSHENSRSYVFFYPFNPNKCRLAGSFFWDEEREGEWSQFDPPLYFRRTNLISMYVCMYKYV